MSVLSKHSVVVIVIAAGALALGLAGRDVLAERYEVTCEPPYYSGPVDRFRASSHGTWFLLPDGTELDYPPSVKCEVQTLNGKPSP